MGLIETKDLWKTYTMGDEEIHALRGVSIQIEKGEYVAIMGPSGSGKSTLMNLIGCLDTPSQGTYLLNGKEVSTMNDNELARIRNEDIGFVFQTFNLLPRATALHNVELPLVYAGVSSRDRLERAARPLQPIAGRHARVDQWQFDVVERGGARQQVEGLEDEADLAVAHGGELVVVHLGHDLAPQHVAPLGRCVEAPDEVHEGGLSGARGAHDRDVLALLDLEGDAAQRLDLLRPHLVGAPEVLGVDDGPAPGFARGGAHDFFPFVSTLIRASSFRLRRVR